jgi:histidine ammonia-lyase
MDPSATAGIRASAALVRRRQGQAPSTASTPASASWPTSASRATTSRLLQLNLLRSHAVGVGEPLPERVVRLVLLLKAASLARGYSGVREEVIDGLLALYNRGVTAGDPCQGSVGASGDLAPLAHLCLPLIGEGEVWFDGKRMPGPRRWNAPACSRCSSAKEGLALINGTQVSTALALDALLAADRLFEAAVIAGALTLDAARGSDGPSIRASMPCAASRGRSIAPPPTARSGGQRHPPLAPGRTTTACRTRTACAASRR